MIIRCDVRMAEEANATRKVAVFASRGSSVSTREGKEFESR
jgi:hypothetical protein